MKKARRKAKKPAGRGKKVAAKKAKAAARPKRKKSAARPKKASPKPKASKKAKTPKAAAKSKKQKTAGKASKEHPKLAVLLARLTPGRHAGGTLIVTALNEHKDEMREWLMGNDQGRMALGRSAFGDILVFRDLRSRAKEMGLPTADACDVALIDVNYKRMSVLAPSIEAFLDLLDDAAWQNQFLRRELYDAVKARLGDYADDEAYAFVPALPLGGSESADNVERAKWLAYQDILFQS